MGLDNRDYLRDEAKRYGEGGGTFGGGRGSFGAETPVCRNILIVTIVVFLAQVFIVRGWTHEELATKRDLKIDGLQYVVQQLRDNSPATIDSETESSSVGNLRADIERLENKIVILQTAKHLTPEMLDMREIKVSIAEKWLQMETPKVMQGQIWRLATYAFCHERQYLGHIIFNMIVMWMFGRRLESMYGSKEFLLFYMAAAVVAGACYMALDLVSGTPNPMYGASGAVMGLLTLYAVHFPRETIYVFFVLPVEIRWVALMYAIYDLHPLLLEATGDPLYDNTAHAAHLGGMAFGYLYGTRKYRLGDYFSGIETWWKARRRGFRVVSADSAPAISKKSQKLADEMDSILKKISEQGEASLTAAERKTLERVSRELRDRRD